MRLWHSTNEAGRDGIQAHGFRHEDPPVGPAWDAEDRGYAWFATSKDVGRRTRNRSGWWVIIDVPDDTREHILGDGHAYAGNYRLCMDYVNGLPMTFEQGE